MQAKDMMTSPVLTISPDATVVEIAQLLLERHISAAPVVDDAGKLVGIVSEGDLMRRPESGTERHPSWWLSLISDPRKEAREFVKHHGLHARDVMSRHVVSVSETTPLQEVASLLEKHRIKRVPVLRDGKVVGIVSRANLLQGLLAREPASSEDPAGNEKVRSLVTSELARHGWATNQTACVVAESGVVHLWGFVNSDAVRDAYRIAAENVRGVKRVENHMKVLPPEARLGV